MSSRSLRAKRCSTRDVFASSDAGISMAASPKGGAGAAMPPRHSLHQIQPEHQGRRHGHEDRRHHHHQHRRAHSVGIRRGGVADNGDHVRLQGSSTGQRSKSSTPKKNRHRRTPAHSHFPGGVVLVVENRPHHRSSGSASSDSTGGSHRSSKSNRQQNQATPKVSSSKPSPASRRSRARSDATYTRERSASPRRPSSSPALLGYSKSERVYKSDRLSARRNQTVDVQARASQQRLSRSLSVTFEEELVVSPAPEEDSTLPPVGETSQNRRSHRHNRQPSEGEGSDTLSRTLKRRRFGFLTSYLSGNGGKHGRRNKSMDEADYPIHPLSLNQGSPPISKSPIQYQNHVERNDVSMMDAGVGSRYRHHHHQTNAQKHRQKVAPSPPLILSRAYSNSDFFHGQSVHGFGGGSPSPPMRSQQIFRHSPAESTFDSTSSRSARRSDSFPSARSQTIAHDGYHGPPRPLTISRSQSEPEPRTLVQPLQPMNHQQQGEKIKRRKSSYRSKRNSTRFGETHPLKLDGADGGPAGREALLRNQYLCHAGGGGVPTTTLSASPLTSPRMSPPPPPLSASHRRTVSSDSQGTGKWSIRKMLWRPHKPHKSALPSPVSTLSVPELYQAPDMPELYGSVTPSKTIRPRWNPIIEDDELMLPPAISTTFSTEDDSESNTSQCSDSDSPLWFGDPSMDADRQKRRQQRKELRMQQQKQLLEQHQHIQQQRRSSLASLRARMQRKVSGDESDDEEDGEERSKDLALSPPFSPSQWDNAGASLSAMPMRVFHLDDDEHAMPMSCWLMEP